MVQTAELSAVEIVVKGRNVEIPDHYRQHVQDKLAKLERYDHKLIRLDVELFHEPNRRQATKCQRVEITGRSAGPAIRAEATAQDFYSALDAAMDKVESRLRRAADRRRVHHGRRTPISVAAATAPLAKEFSAGLMGKLEPPSTNGHSAQSQADQFAVEENLPGVVRRKEHTAKPMTTDQALFEMELVGHDFYLFHDVDSGRPSVVYRRKGYDYGLIALTP